MLARSLYCEELVFIVSGGGGMLVAALGSTGRKLTHGFRTSRQENLLPEKARHSANFERNSRSGGTAMSVSTRPSGPLVMPKL